MPLLVAGYSVPSSLALIWVVAHGSNEHLRAQHRRCSGSPWRSTTRCSSSAASARARRGRAVEEAVERAVGTAGKAVVLAVAIGLSGLLLFGSAIRSIGIAGALVVLCSVIYGLTFLPAVLGILGHRVNSLSIGGLRHRIRPVADGVSPPGRRAGNASRVQ
jgi:hypothetical protein